MTAPPPEIARLQALCPDARWRHEPALPLNSIDHIASVTNQVRSEPIDRPTVQRYVAALEAGDVFPPIVVREIPGPGREAPRLVNLGGNHRSRAHIEAGRKTIDAWVVTVDDDLAALEIAYHDNATHGLQLPTSERIAHALRLIAAGRTQNHAARMVGLSAATLSAHRSQVTVAERAERLGIGQDLVRIPMSVRPNLVSIKDDRLFTRVVQTVVKERIPSSHISPLIASVNAQPTADAARKVLAEHVRHHRGVAGAARGRGNPGRAPRILATTAMSTLAALDPKAVVDDTSSRFDREQLAKTAMAAARGLKAIHDLAKAADR